MPGPRQRGRNSTLPDMMCQNVYQQHRRCCKQKDFQRHKAANKTEKNCVNDGHFTLLRWFISMNQ
jgi:hypothetical protein